MLLQNKKIVIIGGTTGIGLAAALYFCEQGAYVVALGIPEKNDVQNKIISKNHVVLYGDAMIEGTAENAIDNCIENFNGFDGLGFEFKIGSSGQVCH